MRGRTGFPYPIVSQKAGYLHQLSLYCSQAVNRLAS